MATTGRTRHTIERRAVVLLVVVAGLFLSGCGAKKTQAQTVPAGTEGTERIIDLVGTEWVIVKMAGFPGDNIVIGNFDFTNQRFRYYDGVNHASFIIAWDESGFTVKAGGDSTTVGVHEGYPGPYLKTLVPVGARVEIVRNADGSLTLTRDELTVTAEPA